MESPRLLDGAPPFPSMILGRGQWVRVIEALRRTGRKADADLAERIRRDIEDRAGR